jgi:hypothetical protein
MPSLFCSYVISGSASRPKKKRLSSVMNKLMSSVGGNWKHKFTATVTHYIATVNERHFWLGQYVPSHLTLKKNPTVQLLAHWAKESCRVVVAEPRPVISYYSIMLSTACYVSLWEISKLTLLTTEWHSLLILGQREPAPAPIGECTMDGVWKRKKNTLWLYSCPRVNHSG